MSREEGHPPIREYAAIGDCHGSALVSREGSVDWCCLGRFDADPVFCRLLDTGKGGFFSIRPAGDCQVARAYVSGTNILQTTFSTGTGTVRLTDFLPVGRRPGAGVHDYVTLSAPFWLVRIVECLKGTVRVDVRYRPTLEFARRRARLEHRDGTIVADGGPSLHGDEPLGVRDDMAEATFELSHGERRRFVLASRLDPETREFLGNFPQALSHLGLIQSAVHLELCERHGPQALRGTYADRARYGVESTGGLRGLWAAFRKTGRVGRIRSSRASILPSGL